MCNPYSVFSVRLILTSDFMTAGSDMYLIIGCSRAAFMDRLMQPCSIYGPAPHIVHGFSPVFLVSHLCLGLVADDIQSSIKCIIELHSLKCGLRGGYI